MRIHVAFGLMAFTTNSLTFATEVVSQYDLKCGEQATPLVTQVMGDLYPPSRKNSIGSEFVVTGATLLLGFGDALGASAAEEQRKIVCELQENEKTHPFKPPLGLSAFFQHYLP